MIAQQPQLSLRTAASGDVDVLADLIAPSLPLDADPAAAARGELDAVASAPTRGLALLEMEGTPLGALGWWADHPEPGVALLGFLTIRPEERRRGLGARALGLLLDELRRSAVRSVRTAVSVRDYPAHAFLRAQGFTEMSIRDHVAMGQAGLNLLLFAREVT
jgi:ribosomal protein S18 acetylase RimI-like enzyme